MLCATNNWTTLLLISLLASFVVLRCLQESPANKEFAAAQQRRKFDEPAGDERGDLLVFIGYLSAPGNQEKRKWLRDTCFPRIRDDCWVFNTTTEKSKSNDVGIHPHEGRPGWGASCDGRFFIGHPNDPAAASSRQGHKQGALATNVEIDLARSLQNESDHFRDIQMIPMRDSYIELPDKTLSILRHGVQSGAETILKIDDDQCPNMTKVLEVAISTPRNVARYVGGYRWEGTEYDSMKGADGSIDPYMSGPGYLLSRSLAHAVAVDDINHSVLYMPYGSSSEDVDMGKWFAHANRTHPELKFVFEVMQGLTKAHELPGKQ